MCPTRLHAAGVARGLLVDGRGEPVELFAERLRELERGEAHRGRCRVVGRLRHVHVVVRVHVLVGAEASAEQLVRAVGDDLVHVHVERHACARMEDVDHELIEMPAFEDLVACFDDRVLAPIVESACLGVGESGGALHPDERPDKRREGPISADRVVLDRPLGLRAPERVRGNFDLAQRVALAPRRHSQSVQ